jgi:hypothetical protein
MIIFEVLTKNSPQMSFIEDDRMIETFSAD